MEFLTNQPSELLVTLVAGGGAFAVVMMIWYGLMEASPVKHRMQYVQDYQRRAGPTTRPSRSRERPTAMGTMRGIVAKAKLMQASQTNARTLKLARAGYRSRDSIIVYLFAKLVSPFIFGALSLVVGSFALPEASMSQTGLIGMGGVLLGFYAPELYLSNIASRRQQAMQKALPDALDLMVVCAEAGLSLDASLGRVANELAHSCAELADELSVTAVELAFLPERKTALTNLAMRADLQAIRAVVNTLSQTEKYGTPLSQSLRVLANEFREQRMLKAEEKAARLPAVLTVPMILFILPTLFIVLVGPAMLDLYDKFLNK
ncbi:MAG: type II secretion system F family protein [Geminicoccaceae bacterium]